MIENIMSKNLITAQKNSTIWECATLMKKHDIGFLPIYDNKKLIGVITDRDIVIRVISENYDLNSKVHKFMSDKIKHMDINKTVKELIEKMAEEKIKRILISENKKIIGVVSLSNIFDYYKEKNEIVNLLSQIDTIKSIHAYKHDTDVSDFPL
ncbi:MAG: CBS domain-containing protein [Bacilli bacterium]